MDIGAFLNVLVFVSAILSILLILLQQRGASLGAGFGGSGELNTDFSNFNCLVNEDNTEKEWAKKREG